MSRKRFKIELTVSYDADELAEAVRVSGMIEAAHVLCQTLPERPGVTVEKAAAEVIDPARKITAWIPTTKELLQDFGTQSAWDLANRKETAP